MKLIDQVIKDLLIECLEKCGGSKKAAAAMMGISKRCFQNYEIKFGQRPKQAPTKPPPGPRRPDRPFGRTHG